MKSSVAWLCTPLSIDKTDVDAALDRARAHVDSDDVIEVTVVMVMADGTVWLSSSHRASPLMLGALELAKAGVLEVLRDD